MGLIKMLDDEIYRVCLNFFMCNLSTMILNMLPNSFYLIPFGYYIKDEIISIMFQDLV